MKLPHSLQAIAPGLVGAALAVAGIAAARAEGLEVRVLSAVADAVPDPTEKRVVSGTAVTLVAAEQSASFGTAGVSPAAEQGASSGTAGVSLAARTPARP